MTKGIKKTTEKNARTIIRIKDHNPKSGLPEKGAHKWIIYPKQERINKLRDIDNDLMLELQTLGRTFGNVMFKTTIKSLKNQDISNKQIVLIINEKTELRPHSTTNKQNKFKTHQALLQAKVNQGNALKQPSDK